MSHQKGENPYQVALDPEVETEGGEAKGEIPVLRIVGLVTVVPLMLLFCISFLFDLEVKRFSSIALQDVVFFTGISFVIATVILPVFWAVAGFVVRRKKVPALSQQEAVLFVLKWIAGTVVCFATLPSVIEGFGTTYPISEYTIQYFLLLALAMGFLVTENFLRYRREADQKSAFICCLGAIIVIMAVGMVGLFIFAIAASALT